MRATWMNPNEVACSESDLLAEAILTERFNPAASTEVASRLKAERSYGAEDDIRLTTKDAAHEARIARESDEHAHMEDEVRLILEGEGVYDVRARDERWLRVNVGAGDLIVIPARRYHRFLVGKAGSVRYVQPFAERSGLIPLYRASDDETRC